MDLLIFSGQSNMQGQTEAVPESKVIKRAYEYKLLTDKVTPLCHPVGENIGDLLLAPHLGRGSLMPHFCEKYVECSDRDVLAVHTARGATTISQWLSDNEVEKSRYEILKIKVREAIKRGGVPDKRYFIWLQGESDALCNTTCEEYKERLIKLKNDLKNDIGIDKFMIIQVGYFAIHYNGGNKAADEAVMKAQMEICNEDSDFLMLTDKLKEITLNEKYMKYMSPEAVGHFNNEGLKYIGELAGETAGKFAIK